MIGRCTEAVGYGGDFANRRYRIIITASICSIPSRWQTAISMNISCDICSISVIQTTISRQRHADRAIPPRRYRYTDSATGALQAQRLNDRADVFTRLQHSSGDRMPEQPVQLRSIPSPLLTSAGRAEQTVLRQIHAQARLHAR